MLKLNKIFNIAHRWGIINDIYTQDPEFVKNVHKCAPNLIECVNGSIANISAESEFYAVCTNVFHEKTSTIGFFSIHTKHEAFNILEGFHILPKFRKSIFLGDFWQYIKSTTVGKPIVIGIWDKNTAAISHLQHNGFSRIGLTDVDGKTHWLMCDKNY